MIRRDDLEAMPCPCGCDHPMETWLMMGGEYVVECPVCENKVYGDTADAARAGWNMEARAMLARGVAA